MSLFNDPEFKALKHDLDLKPIFTDWPADALVEYSDSIIDEVVEEEIQSQIERDMLHLSQRNHNRKNIPDVYFSDCNQLQIPNE